jgi:hypothetical protein
MIDASQTDPSRSDQDARPQASLVKRVYRLVPLRIRELISPPVYAICGILDAVRPKVWSVAGDGQGGPMRVCLETSTPLSMTYISELIFGPSREACNLGRTWVWRLQKLPKAAYGSSLLFSEFDARFLRWMRPGGGVAIPSWVVGEAVLPRGAEERNSKGAKNRRRSILHNSLEFDVTRDPGHFDDFYDNMYLPYIKDRFGDGAGITPRGRLRKMFDDGELLRVKRNGEYLAGMLIDYQGDSAGLRIIGVRDGNWAHVQAGAIAALYEFSLNHLERRGCLRVKLFRSRAFLQDGVLRAKRRLSQRIVGIDPRMFTLRVLTDSPATRRFLEGAPFIFERLGKLRGAVFVACGTELTVETLGEINRKYFHSGMSELIVFQFTQRPGVEDGEPKSLVGPVLADEDAQERSHSVRYRKLPRVEWEDLICGLGATCIAQAVAIIPRSTGQDANALAQEN